MDDDRIISLVAGMQKDFVDYRVRALEEWMRHPEPVRMSFRGTRTMWMHESAIAYAELNPKCSILVCGNQKCVRIVDGDDVLAVSMKSIRPGTLETSNYPTRTRKKIRQTGFINLDGRVLTFVNCGYILEMNAVGLEEKISRMFLTREVDGEVKLKVPMYTAKRGLIPMLPDSQESLFFPPAHPLVLPPAVESLPQYRIKARVASTVAGMPKVGTKKKDVASPNVSKEIGHEGA